MPEARNHWVVLSSANGSTNLGDEAMWEATVLVLRQLLGPVPVITDGHAGFQPELEEVEVRPYLHLSLRRGWWMPAGLLERAVSWPARNAHAMTQARALARRRQLPPHVADWCTAITSADGLIISGAGAMTDDFAPHGVVSWWLATRWAKQAGVPVYVLGQGVGPLVNSSLRAMASELLTGCATVNVREPRSAEVAKQLVPGLSPSVSPDWAMLDVPSTADRQYAEEYLRTYVGGGPFVAVSAHRRHDTSAARLRHVSDFMEDVVAHARAKGKRVVFVPNMTGSGYSDDRATFDLLARAWSTDNQAAVHVVRQRLGPRRTRALLGHADLLVTTRYHPLIFAFAERVPVVGISYDDYYEQKLVGASSVFGVTGNVLQVQPRATTDIESWMRETKPVCDPLPEVNVTLLREALSVAGGV